MPPLEVYLVQADKLAQELVNTWAALDQAGDSDKLTPEFRSLVDKALLYQDARSLADDLRQREILSKQDETEERGSLLAFAKAYKGFYEKHAAAS